jgi:hypothetical protein
MNKLISWIALCLFLGCPITSAQTAANGENLAATINYLLAFVEKSDGTFST